jgi:hypothetical protein
MEVSQFLYVSWKGWWCVVLCGFAGDVLAGSMWVLNVHHADSTEMASCPPLSPALADDLFGSMPELLCGPFVVPMTHNAV